MDSIIIRGNGPLRGEVVVSGAKNSALPILASTLLAPGIHTFRNVPRLADVTTMLRVLEHMGCVWARGRGALRDCVQVAVPKKLKAEAPYSLVKTMRAAIVVLGPLVARTHQASVSMPGGCAIGARPIDQHLKGLRAMGAQIDLADGYVHAAAKALRGTTFAFDVPSVTGTENLMCAAALARGRTILENAAREPEIVDLAGYLVSMGAQVIGAGTDVITVDGVRTLSPSGHTIIADRIEAGTLMIAGAITGGNVLVKGAVADHVEALIGKLRETGCKVTLEARGIRVVGPATPRAVDVATQVHPGFPTDMQAQLMALLTCAKGTSVFTENIFENRFMHVAELRRLGANISVTGRTAVVHGVLGLSGAQVMATDLRASASLVLAGLAAEGKTTVNRVYHLDRGYESLDKKLHRLGASIRRVRENRVQ